MRLLMHILKVQAKEVGTPEGRGLSRPIQLRVHLNDVNDNSPVLPLINPVTLESGDGIRTVMKVRHTSLRTNSTTQIVDRLLFLI